MVVFQRATSRVFALLVLCVASAAAEEFTAKSGIGIWVDPATPDNRQVYKSSRGVEWHLVMSDEFNTPNRSFKPGDDHMWTSIDKPDGVNSALEVYSHNMTSTACDADGTCYFYIKAMDEVIPLRVWNDYLNPPGYQIVTFFYRSAMVQSWNKFCYQGGMVEVRAKLPGIVDANSGNPDLKGGPSARASSLKYYPTWPGIWMMGNLGRAVFSASTTRMWPFSYDECNENAFKASNQRISACDANPGHGMNPNQGRGAPEIDIIEGAGNEISTSMQIGPGMPEKFRIIYPTEDAAAGCVYTGTCKTQGANVPDVPTKYYESKRGYKTWYQGMRYAANNFCASTSNLKQDAKTVRASVAAGITENTCTLTNCPASRDVNGDLSLIGNSKTDYWGINSNGTCYSVMNGYTGAYLCSPGNPSPLCPKSDAPQSDKVAVFEYRMDALSANWPIHVEAYTDYLVYQMEWIPGGEGYVRWMLAGQPLYEIPASTITNPPQDPAKTNPVKIMVEEPMYMIFNVALSSMWGAKPPTAWGKCRGDGKDAEINKICDAFPLYLKIDYIRLYQDTSAGSKMQVGCDPKSHPTRQWIQDYIESYQDYENLAIDVSGKAFCRNDNDCTIASNKTTVATGSCVKSRCRCVGSSWTGPRCTAALGTIISSSGNDSPASAIAKSYGPPWFLALGTSGFTILATMLAVFMSVRSEKKDESVRKQKAANAAPMTAAASGRPSAGFARVSNFDGGAVAPGGKRNTSYSTNFV